MGNFLEGLNSGMEMINGVLWHDSVLYVILGTGLLFLIWSKFSPWLALTHGVQVVRGKFDHKGDPGAISHFQALSAALSATVGLGNIGGVAVAIALGGPGAVFWMWIVGLVGMAIKTTEVTQSMLYRNTDDPDDPHGGPMMVVSEGLKRINPGLASLGKGIGVLFCVTLLISAVTGGNMFQAWNVGNVTQQNFGIGAQYVGVILAIICGLVIIGGIKRIGNVAGKLVPFMCGLYLVAALAVLAVNISEIPSMLLLIVQSAFNPTEAQGAFLGGTVGFAFLWGMKRALFSNEAGQGSAPIAHSAAMTDEPVREGVVAGLEPFIDTIVVCTLTALVILASGAWNRAADIQFENDPQVVASTEGEWTIESGPIPLDAKVKKGDDVFIVLNTGTVNEATGLDLEPIYGKVESKLGELVVNWNTIKLINQPTIADPGLHVNYVGASLTSHAFDRVFNGLGKYLVTFASWLFAISTIISWSYYGEQGVIFMLGKRAVVPYKIIYCVLIVLATSGFITTTRELDNLTGIGTGVMLFANIPIMLIFGRQAMIAYHDYRKRLQSGEIRPTAEEGRPA